MKYQLSRTANGHLAFDSHGALHAAYWAETRKDFTTPEYPSFVFHQTWRRGSGWSAPEQVDDSLVPGVGRLGGRHPSLAVAPDDTIWIAWQDHRHCTELGHWIDNTEIYADFKPPGGFFSATDLRLTTSAAAHSGDNGYAPKIVAHASGRLSVTWHDFHANPDVSDIYLKTSGPSGVFNTGEPMASMRMTDLNDRGGAPEFTVPDLAVDTTGTRHLTWAAGQGSGVDLYYAEAPLGASSATARLLAPHATDFFDPPHVAAAPQGDVWIAYGDDGGANGEDVTLLRRRAGQPGFDPPFVIDPLPARQYAPDPEIDSQGHVHLVWIDERSGTHVYYGLFDPASGQLLQETSLTPASGPWARPTLALDAHDNAYVVFEENRGVTAGDLWFTTDGPTVNSAGARWADYE